MTGWIYLIGTVIIVGLMFKHFSDEADLQEAKRKRNNPPNAILEFEKPVGPWAYFANAIYPRQFEHH